jgi:hypothetical protein
MAVSRPRSGRSNVLLLQGACVILACSENNSIVRLFAEQIATPDRKPGITLKAP